MNKREKMLIGAVACLVALFVGRMFLSNYSKGLAKLRSDLAKAKKDLTEVDVKLAMSHKAVGRLATWRGQSLPNDAETPGDFQSQEHAFSVYSQWLSETLTGVGLKPDKLDTNPNTTSISPSIRTIGVSVETKGSLEPLIEFLHKFYSTPQLHQISRIELRPVTGQPGNLTIKLQAEALMLPGATNAKVPPEGKLNPFLLADVGDYRKEIGRRDIFAPYKKPSVAPREPTATVDIAMDDSSFARFTGATQGPKGLLAWVYLMNKGDQMLVAEGDSVNVGRLKSKVVSIENRALILDKSDGNRVRVEIGGYLVKDAKVVPKPAPPVETPKTDGDGDGEVNAGALESENL